VPSFMPIILMLTGAILQMYIPSDDKIFRIVRFFKRSKYCFVYSSFIGVLLLGVGQKKKMVEVMEKPFRFCGDYNYDFIDNCCGVGLYKIQVVTTVVQESI